MIKNAISIFIFIAFTSLVNASEGSVQTELENAVRQTLDLPYPQNAVELEARLGALGDASLPIIASVLQLNSGGLPFQKKVFLINYIGKIQSKAADDSMVVLLSSKEPLLRGLAVTLVGRRKQKSSIAHLIERLDDEAVFKETTHTDPYTKVSVQVRFVAVEALQEIENKIFRKGGSLAQKIQAWKTWWLKQKQK